jgi:amidophosphoribosyltransferase
LQDLRDSITEVTPAGKKKIEQFDTSCFSGEYVTGQTVGDEYFTRLHNLRNDGAQEKRKLNVISGGDDNNGRAGSRPKPEQSNNGCESMSNDNAEAPSKGDDAREPLTNQPIGLYKEEYIF